MRTRLGPANSARNSERTSKFNRQSTKIQPEMHLKTRPNDMMALWFSTKFHPPASEDPRKRRQQIEMDQGLLIIALRAFLYTADLPGALIVLRTTSELGLPITERTYFVVMRFLTRQVYYDIYRARLKAIQPLFAFELIGPFDPRAITRDENAAYHWIMERLLAHNGREGTHHGSVPTVERILAQETAGPSGERLDHWPLVNMLQRALQIRAAERAKMSIPWGHNYRKRKLAQTQEEMVPKDIPMWTSTRWKTRSVFGTLDKDLKTSTGRGIASSPIGTVTQISCLLQLVPQALQHQNLSHPLASYTPHRFAVPSWTPFTRFATPSTIIGPAAPTLPSMSEPSENSVTRNSSSMAHALASLEDATRLPA
ncbi:hypothetical protein B0H15DRAFT_981033 [Mycena belliarum]|uniref:Uncharacterized protein n=1 Tax=Mycena belliarum TaxID=1033014 RepID=A0AAD6TKD1_9AGAR|nr:hypothetical protein B0H15DRAFT_981033 [Mycena belliae]